MIMTAISALIMVFAIIVSVGGVKEAYRRYQQNRLEFDGVGIFIAVGGTVMLILALTDGLLFLAIAWGFLISLEAIKVFLWWVQEDEEI